jgi:YegS/Rv2252/BmrU family lipid kinase
MEAATILNRDKADRTTVEEALRSAGVDGSIELVEGKRIAARAKVLVEHGAKLVIVGGGDGTVGAAASALKGSKTTLGILPLGTLNHFARDLSIPFALDEAAALIAKGKTRTVDQAEVNGRTFVNNSAIGLYPLMVVDRDSQQHRLGRSKRLAMLVASFRTLMNFHDHRLTLTTDEDRSSVDTPLLFVGNNDYRLALPAAGQREALDDGKLCVLVMRKKRVPGFHAATARALVGWTRDDDMIRMDAVSRLRVDSGRATLTVSVDGETVSMKPPLDYRIRPGALRVRVAPDEEATRRKASKS